MVPANRLGEFLRVRREQLAPDERLGDLGRRRVAGLRREEVASLAGVSTDYYTRLEQGRSRHPSEQVVDAVARALRLDRDATAYLHQLARPPQLAQAPVMERVPRTVVALLDAWSPSPAFVVSATLDVLASNAAARAVCPMHEVGVNLLRHIFLDPDASKAHPDLDAFGERLVATLRATAGIRLGEPRVVGLVEELVAGSEAFRRLWAQHLVRGRGYGTKRFAHPAVGELVLEYRTFAINGEDAVGQTLVTYHAPAGTASDDALSSLAGQPRYASASSR